MFTRKSIVKNMHKGVMFLFIVFILNAVMQKMKVKETKLLLRQRFNNKISYTHYAARLILFNCYLQYRVV